MWLEPGDARQIEGGATRPLAAFAGRPGVAAAAGIGNPQRFFATLRGAGITPEPALALPDHHDYAQSPFRDWHAESILVTSATPSRAALHDARLWKCRCEPATRIPSCSNGWRRRCANFPPAASAAAGGPTLVAGRPLSISEERRQRARRVVFVKARRAPACRRRITASGRCTSTSSAASSSHAVGQRRPWLIQAAFRVHAQLQQARRVAAHARHQTIHPERQRLALGHDARLAAP